MNQTEQLPFTPEVPAAQLLSIMKGYQQTLFFYQAFQTGIFDALQEAKNAATLSSETGWHEDRLVFFLDALTAMKLLDKRGEDYVIAPIARTYLIQSSPFYLGDLIQMDDPQEQIRSWEMIPSWLQGVSSGNEVHEPTAVFRPSFIHAMAQSVFSSNSFQETISAVSTHPSFSTAQKLLDVGGGHGLFAIALKQLKADLQAVIFDLHQVEPVTQHYAERYGTKIGFHAGNFYEDELPPDQDIVLTFDILHPVPPEQKEAVFKKVYAALNKGGCLFYRLWFLDDTRTHPQKAALFSLKQKIKNQDCHVYTRSEAEQMLTAIGFQVEEALSLRDGASTILIARKVG